QFFFRLKQVLDLALAGLDDLQQSRLHRLGGAQPAFQVGVLLGDVLAADALSLQLADLTQFLAEVEHESVERLGRHADDDAAAHLAVGQLLAIDRGDEAVRNCVDQLGHGGDGGIERVDLKLDLAGADNDLARHGRRLLLRVVALSRTLSLAFTSTVLLAGRSARSSADPVRLRSLGIARLALALTTLVLLTGGIVALAGIGRLEVVRWRWAARRDARAAVSVSAGSLTWGVRAGFALPTLVADSWRLQRGR